MWAVGITRPYYPSVKFFEDRNEADKTYLELLNEEPDEDGQYDCKIFISKVEYMCNIKTHY